MSDLQQYYTEEEVLLHNSHDDCWVSVFEYVFNLTPLIGENRGELSRPLEKAAGQNLSHWFMKDEEGFVHVKTHVDPIRNIRMPYTPEGRFIHVPPPDAREWDTSFEKPWWQDETYMVGKLTAQKRLIKVMNMLTKTENTINVCKEEKIESIRKRYMEYNKHSESYTWKALVDGEFAVLDMDKTLEDNGVIDETEEFFKLGLDDDFYVPTLHLYFDDDLTYA